VAIGIGSLGRTVDLALVGLAVLGLALSAGLWWAYFGNGGDEEAERALEEAPQADRPRMALGGYGFPHIAILLGIVAIAAAEKHAIGHGSEHLVTVDALYLAVGAAIFLVGDAVFRRVLGIGHSTVRAAAGVAALATLPLGLAVSAVAQLLALVAVLAVAVTLEAGPATR
jgi:low temperature requirement protein LtrA